MITRKNLILFVLGVVISPAYGAPLKGDVNATLSDETRWPFLKQCDKNCEIKDEFLCPEYLLAKENVTTCISDANDTEIFSTPVETFGNMSYFCNVSFKPNRNVTIKDDFQLNCELVCLERKVKEGSVVDFIKPLCRLISWIRSNCSTKHGSASKETSSAAMASQLSEKGTISAGKHSPLLEATSSKVTDAPGAIPINPKSQNSKTITSNPSEGAQNNPDHNETQKKGTQQNETLPNKTSHKEISPEKTSTIVISKTTTTSVDQAKGEENAEEFQNPLSDGKSNEAKTTVALPSTPTKKSSVTTGNTSADTSLKTQDEEAIAVNNSEQNNAEDADQDEQPKIGDESSYEETGNMNEYPNVDPVQKKPDLEQDTNIVPGKDWMAPKSKAHSYFLEPEDSGSNFFSYFLFGMFLCIFLYVVYHNKSKILALVLEGRRTSSSRSGSKRKHTAAYRKLDTNLEEAITSSASGRTSQIIY